jgi:hypothetical protein
VLPKVSSGERPSGGLLCPLKFPLVVLCTGISFRELKNLFVDLQRTQENTIAHKIRLKTNTATKVYAFISSSSLGFLISGMTISIIHNESLSKLIMQTTLIKHCKSITVLMTTQWLQN